MIDDAVCRNWVFGERVHRYSARDTMLYALGLGLGTDPMNRQELRFVYEQGLQAIPTMAAVMGTPGIWWKDPRTGADAVKLVHGEQHLRLHRPLAPAGALVARNRVVSITDKGAGKGALAVQRRDLVDEGTGEPVAELTSLSFLRGDGGYSAGGRGVSDPPPPSLPPVPERAADWQITYRTAPGQALVYRLSGDDNPLHADPDFAARAGFAQPILHGLCTYGMGARAVIEQVLGFDASRLRGLAVRFTSPVFPGDAVRYEIWRGEAGRLHLRASVDARGVVVLNSGVAELF